MQYGRNANGKVSIPGVDTSKLETIKESEKTELLKRIRQGDRAARSRMISCNLRLVLSVIQRFSNRGENADDLFQVGCVGLIKAIDNFDIGQNVRFSTYAVPMIIGELRRYLRDNSALRVSRSMRDTAYKALRLREQLTNERGSEPDIDELARAMDMRREDVVFALDAIADPVSLYEPVYSDGTDSVCVMDQVGDEDNTEERWSESVALSEAMGRLSPRERKILALRFYDGRTQNEVSQAVGISQAQVSRLEKAALEKVRKGMM